MKPVLLYGPPGSGKTTIGKKLAKNLDLDFLDLDSAIEKKAGTSIPAIISTQGEVIFRDLESAALDDALTVKNHIISLGGGTLLRQENRRLAETQGEIICLSASYESLITRLHNEDNTRPLLASDMPQQLSALMNNRKEHYASFNNQVITDDRQPDQIARDIQIYLGRYHVNGMEKGYDVIVDPGGIDNLGDYLLRVNLCGPIALVTDSNVEPLYAQRANASLRRAGYKIHVITIKAGEDSKILDTISTLWNSFLKADLDRHSTVVALGGGVISDLAGFAAATFLRGIPWVVIPTSLLAMIDASLGGKTGFDLPEGKNLVGSFYPPRLVIADPDLLTTLPDSELRSGLAEVVKHGIISDPVLFNLCASDYAVLKRDIASLVSRAMAVKIDIINTDPFERNQRAVLNLGHTVGHALETVSNYRLRHGEAVAIGMVIAARLSERLGKTTPGLTQQIASVLSQLGLPTEIPTDLSRPAILKTIQMDKKRANGNVRLVLPIEIGRVDIGIVVDNLNIILEE